VRQPLWLSTPSFAAAVQLGIILAMLDRSSSDARADPPTGTIPSSSHPLFDLRWYSASAPDGPAHQLSFGHYLSEGWRRLRSPHPLFSVEFYFENRPDVRLAGREPLYHFVTQGWKEWSNPHALFDVEFYLSQAPNLGGLDPLSHYVTVGWRHRFRPNKFFDPNWYLSTYPDVGATGHEPIFHYLLWGWKENRQLMPEIDLQAYRHHCGLSEMSNPLLSHVAGGGRKILAFGAEPTSAEKPARHNDESKLLDVPHCAHPQKEIGKRASAEFTLSRAPLVSIIITNKNGAQYLPDLFSSLNALTYKNFEIIFVDDASTDGSAEIATKLGAHKTVLTSETVGFAQANNIGLTDSSGELIALLNNDTRVDPNWLERMISAMRRSNSIAAVAPKVRFWSQFQRVNIEGAHYFQVDRDALVASLRYEKYFVRNGKESAKYIEAVQIGDNYSITIDLPLQNDEISFTLVSKTAQVLSVSAAAVSKAIILKEEITEYGYAFSESAKREGFYIVNNAGSVEFDALNPRDRGLGEVDDGQYDREEDVDLFCGCATLIRRDALHGLQLFIGEFIAYYEDSELSKRLRRDGYRITYVPDAIVYHRHSATNVERSLFWRKQTSRNEILFKYIFSDSKNRPDIAERGKANLNHLRHWYAQASEATETEISFAREIPTIVDEIDQIAALIDREQIPRRNGMRIGLYNPYWTTMGGGEAHALDIAKSLSDYGQVELISNNDFDLAGLTLYFNVNHSKFRKRLISNMTSEVTAEYDIFVNSAYQSEVTSYAKTSYYIVSFPSRMPTKDFLRSYHFLANSNYTMRWMRKFWGSDTFSGEVLYPAIPQAMLLNSADLSVEKKKIVLSVGRFVSTGHTKNQLEIARAFRHLNETAPKLVRDWTLVLTGSANDSRYVGEVETAIAGLSANIVADASFEEVRQLYRHALVYVHAAGCGRDEETEPELFEHFGMAVAQAVGGGCVPIVFSAAGPKEIVDKVGLGFTYKTVEDLARTLAKVLPTLDDPERSIDVRRRLIEKAALFSRDTQARQLKQLIEQRTGTSHTNSRSN
jgi:GT2 family glycosyltransferase